MDTITSKQPTMPWGESKATIYIDRTFHQKLITAAKADRRSIGDYVQHHLEPIINQPNQA